MLRIVNSCLLPRLNHCMKGWSKKNTRMSLQPTPLSPRAYSTRPVYPSHTTGTRPDLHLPVTKWTYASRGHTSAYNLRYPLANHPPVNNEQSYAFFGTYFTCLAAGVASLNYFCCEKNQFCCDMNTVESAGNEQEKISTDDIEQFTEKALRIIQHHQM